MIDGFEFYSKCRCGGVLKHKYHKLDNKSNKYYLLPTKNQAQIIKNNRLIGTYPLSELENKLKENGII